MQALVTLNDPVYVEAADNLARLAMQNFENDLFAQIDYMYQRALFQSPSKEQEEELVKFYNTTLDELTNISEAKAVLINYKPDSTKELKALSQVANVILNLDEFLMKS